MLGCVLWMMAVLVHHIFVRKVTCFGRWHMQQDLLRVPFLLIVILRLLLHILLYTFSSLFLSIFSSSRDIYTFLFLGFLDEFSNLSKNNHSAGTQYLWRHLCILVSPVPFALNSVLRYTPANCENPSVHYNFKYPFKQCKSPVVSVVTTYFNVKSFAFVCTGCIFLCFISLSQQGTNGRLQPWRWNRYVVPKRR